MRSILPLSVAGLALALPAVPAFAQTAQPVPPDPSEAAAQDPGDPAVGDGIVVTARRRAEKSQDVPIALSVVDARQLEATGSINVARLTQLQPSLTFFSTNPRNSAANIRGLGAPFGLTNDGIEQGVGVYIDQVYNSRIAVASFDFLDAQQVEVLRGPQGTLYGKNVTAGAINLTSRQPTFEFEGRAETTIGNLDLVQAKAAVSGPLVADTVAIRLAAAKTHRRGTIFNVTTRRFENEQDNLGLRGILLWKATDRLSLTLTGDYNRQNPQCCVQIYVRTGATQRPLNRQYAALAAAFNYAPPSTDPFDRVTDLDATIRAKQQIGGISLRAELEAGPGTLTSVSAWRYWTWDPSNDRDFTGLPITTISQNPSRQNQYTQELRYNVKTGRIDAVLGAFGFNQSLLTKGSQVQGPAASRFLLNPGASVVPGASGCATPTTAACNPAVLNGLTSTNDIKLTNTSLALFGQLGYQVTDALKLQGGLRLNYDKKYGRYSAVVTTGTGSTTLTADQRGVLAPQSYVARFKDTSLSGDFTLTYKISPDAKFYATYSRGFKSGGINLAGLPLDASNNPIQSAATVRPEKVNHYEVGLKTQLFDRHATLNLAAFRTDIRDYQAIVTNGQLGVLRGYLANANKVRVQGAEVDFSARPSDRFRFYANGAFIDAKYRDFKDAPCPPELSGGTTATAGQTPSAPGTPGGISPAACDISGQWLPGVSRVTLSYGGEANVPASVLGKDGEAYLGVDASSRTKFSSNPSRSIYTDINGYTLVNFRAGFRVGDGLNVFGFVRNAFDTNYFEVLALQAGNTGLVVGQPGDPRTYGATVQLSF